MNRRIGVFRIVLILAFLFAIFTVSSRAQEPQGLNETFDDPNLPGWEHPPEVTVIDGVLRMGGGGFAFHGGFWQDFTMKVQTRRMGAGDLLIHYSWSDEGTYIVRLGMGFNAFQREAGGQIFELGGSDALIPTDEWVEVEIIATGGHHEVYVNGDLLMAAGDPDPLPAGGFGFRVEGELSGDAARRGSAAPRGRQQRSWRRGLKSPRGGHSRPRSHLPSRLAATTGPPSRTTPRSGC